MQLTTNRFSVSSIAALVSLFAFACGNQVSTSSDEPQKPTTVDTTVEPNSRKDATKSVQDDVDKQVQGKLLAEKEKVFDQAIEALDATTKALATLEEGKPKRALSQLEFATGKLELLVARHPDLALAPINIETITQDLITTVDAVEEATDRAEELLEDGRIREARALLATMVSEVNVRVTSLPLGSYPEAIKSVAALIGQKKVKEAQQMLADALNTLVVTSYTIPLPVVRAGAMVGSAEAIVENTDSTPQDQKRVSDLLEVARYELEFARALGYGERDAYDEIFSEIEQLENRATPEENKAGLFTGIRERVTNLAESIYSD